MLVKELEAVRARDLEQHFAYSAGTARSYLSCLARQGLLAEPTSSTAAAAIDRLAGAGLIKPTERTVVILSGTGIKSAQTISAIFGEKT